ncbi:hypothetical protein NLX83_31245 [Allokutzneria sp. A3M-2-11 16]|uniref:hypothetical protein n=1 Tax=Allokutzneria sp. A3M-2-11 16 TaxID=2962043 RepID=UPI0020B8778B|nr:hypothetical protein [Allokutzneria sp. A3M-2-11 16]MCP3803757.1 hypothetical protein [Allokutzneria sp. A3M-2-11 16]
MIKRFVLAAVVAAGVAPALAGSASAAAPEGCGEWTPGGLRVCLEHKKGQLVATAFARNGAGSGAKVQICRVGQNKCTRMVDGLKTTGWPDDSHFGNFVAVVSNGRSSAKSLLLSIPFRTPA